jgi:Na+/phosphate symporter
MLIFLPLAFVLGGVFIYFLSQNPKWVEVGRIMMFCGLLAFLLTPSAPMVSFLTHGSDAVPETHKL